MLMVYKENWIQRWRLGPDRSYERFSVAHETKTT